jgi:hypothetical protein
MHQEEQPREQGSYFEDFGLTIDRAKHLYSTLITNALTKGLCESCGKHVALLPAFKVSIATYTEYAETEMEKAYVMYTLGLISRDEYLWAYLEKECRKDTPEETYNAVVSLLDNHIKETKAPLN